MSKLNRFTKNDPNASWSLSLAFSDRKLVQAYMDDYLSTYGDETTRSAFIAALLRQFITEDKPFMKKYGEFTAAEVDALEKKVKTAKADA